MNSSITISLGSDTLSGFFSTEIYPIKITNKINNIVILRLKCVCIVHIIITVRNEVNVPGKGEM